MLPPEKAREGRLGASSRTISSTCTDFRKSHKNQWISNDFAPADHPDRSRRPFFAKSKIALPLGKDPPFRSSPSDFHHAIRCPLRGGPSRPPTSDRTPKSAQDRWCVWELYTPVCFFYGARPILTVRGACGGIWF